jgi:hypothetical protein
VFAVVEHHGLGVASPRHRFDPPAHQDLDPEVA